MNREGHQIRNIIFDLGDVIMDISIEGTLARLSEKSGLSVQDIRNLYWSSEIFLNYEKGLFTDLDFFKGVRDLMKMDLSFDEFKLIWNGMLLRIPFDRLDLLLKIRSSYRIFLLSNTNSLHLEEFTRMIKTVSPHRTIEDYFEKCYFSHLVGMRKPEKEIFQLVLTENNILPQETLFLDDNINNVKGALNAGLHSEVVSNPQILFEIFK